MLLNHFFAETPIDFEKRCRMRVFVGIGVIVLGAAALALALLSQSGLPLIRADEGSHDFIASFYSSTGIALMAAGAVTAVRNLHYLRSPESRRKKEVYETDERNRLIGLRCWAYSGYAMFLLLYAGVLAAGFMSMTAAKVLLTVIALYAALLLIFRILLQRSM